MEYLNHILTDTIKHATYLNSARKSKIQCGLKGKKRMGSLTASSNILISVFFMRRTYVFLYIWATSSLFFCLLLNCHCHSGTLSQRLSQTPTVASPLSPQATSTPANTRLISTPRTKLQPQSTRGGCIEAVIQSY